MVLKATSRDNILPTVIRYTRDGWPNKKHEDQSVEQFRKLADQLSIADGCLFYGSRLVIPELLDRRVLEILHLGHFGIQRMKQLA